MVPAIIAILAVGLLTAMSLNANRRFKLERRLPMQWWLNGSVTWTAPRAIALAFTPVLAAICLSAIAALSISLEPRPGQEGLVLPVNILMAATFIGIHALHLFLIERTLGSNS
jgi:hypothetical protein